MKIVGLTGGIGSGKTTVSKVFLALGVPVYNSDEQAKKLYFLDTVKSKVENLLGREAYISESEINKTHISKSIFNNQEKLEKLNAIIHPAVNDDFENWKNSWKNKTAYILKETALLFEIGLEKKMDSTILVTCSLPERIKRVIKRDGLLQQEVEQKIKKQMLQEEKISLANYIIENEEKTSVLKQVLNIHSILS